MSPVQHYFAPRKDTFTRNILCSPSKEWYRKKTANYQPLGRIGEASDIAKLVAFAVSDDNTFMTGTNLTADGGLLLVCSTFKLDK